MFKVIVLICSLGTSPNDCTESANLMMYESPEFSNSLECNNPQPWIAKLAIKPNFTTEYAKTLCKRIKNA